MSCRGFCPQLLMHSVAPGTAIDFWINATPTGVLMHDTKAPRTSASSIEWNLYQAWPRMVQNTSPGTLQHIGHTSAQKSVINAFLGGL